MIDTNETTNAKINIQAQLDNIWELGGPVALASVAEALNAILAKLGVDAQSLSAAEREGARLSGTALSALAVAKARERSIADAAAKAPEAEMAAMRIFDGDAADPRLVLAQQRDAERELQALSYTVRAELARRFHGNVVTMALRAKSEGLLT